MGHRAAHRRQGRHQLAELISPRLALFVFAAGCARGSITKASKLDVAGPIPSPALEKTPTPRDLPRCSVRRRVAEPATRLGSAGRARVALGEKLRLTSAATRKNCYRNCHRAAFAPLSCVRMRRPPPRANCETRTCSTPDAL